MCLEIPLCCFLNLQAGLAPIKERLFRETVGRYGFKKEFTRATADTMRSVLAEISKRYEQRLH